MTSLLSIISIETFTKQNHPVLYYINREIPGCRVKSGRLATTNDYTGWPKIRATTQWGNVNLC
jgi:hypothetical protein